LLGSSRKSLTGDYTSAAIYGALAQAFVTMIELSGKNRDATPKLAKMMKTIKEDKTKLQKYMKDRSDLKTLKTVSPIFTFPMNVGMQGAAGYGTAGSPAFVGGPGYAGQQGYAPGYGAQAPMMMRRY
jgi:hypothetical protein